MGKSKKTRWRSFSFDGSKDETLVNGAGETKVNGTDDSHQKYSQILGDHHTNNFTTQLSNKSTSSTTSSHIYKARNYNNKENYYNNQRAVLRGGSKNGWHRSNSSISNYRATAFSSKDNKRTDENGKSGSSNDVGGGGNDEENTRKFNEDEYTRITTPRQDVLFKKGYLSRMNSKTANFTLSSSNATASSTIVNGNDSTAPNSTATNSDPESSVSTLSPATTPSMDYAQQDSMEYAPVYYPGYCDENGMLVIPMYNGVHYYPQNGSAANSPVILWPYPYPYDPFFMAPNTEVPVSTPTETDQTTNDGDDEENENEKAENDGAKENNQQHAEEQRNSESKDVKHEEQSSENTAETNEMDEGDQSMKTNYPVYANELSYYYPYPNGYFNGMYYFNGMPVNPHAKPKRRKRFMSSRSSTSHPPRSAETTTDYSDDDNSSQHQQQQPRFIKRNHYSSRHYHHQNGWNNPHNNGFNQYHYNSKYSYNNNKYHYQSSVDQNTPQVSTASDSTSHQQPESNLNVDVQEFYPRVQQANDTKNNQSKAKEQPESKCDVPSKVSAAVDLEQQKASKAHGVKASQQPQIQQSLPPPLPVKATKKEIMEGTKSMEQQNINLIQFKSIPTPASQDVEWNVIKKGKKVKVAKDETVEHETPTKKDMSPEIVSIKIQDTNATETSPKKSSASSPVRGSAKSSAVKKPKGKNKKKKTQHMMTKQQDGFEIIEPQFGNASKSDENATASGEEEEETVIEESIENDSTEIPFASEHIVEKMELLIVNDEKVEETKTEVILKKLNNVEDDGAIIDISDEEICGKTSIEIDLDEIAQQIIGEDEPVEIEEEKIVASEVKPQLSEVKIDLEAKSKDNAEKSLEDVEASIPPPDLELDNLESCPSDPTTPTFDDINFFGDHKNIAELERDLIENLRNMDDGIDIKSPLINPLYDFPITTAVSKWLQEKQNESFDSLFHVQNLKKLSELFDECDDESDISESPNKSETTDSDYASDCQVKANGSPTSSKSATSAKNDKLQAIKGSSNKLKIVKESFCALM